MGTGQRRPEYGAATIMSAQVRNCEAEVQDGAGVSKPKHERRIRKEDGDPRQTDSVVVPKTVGRQSGGPDHNIHSSPLHPHYQATLGGRGSSVSSPSLNKRSSESCHGLGTHTPGKSRLRSALRGNEIDATLLRFLVDTRGVDVHDRQLNFAQISAATSTSTCAPTPVKAITAQRPAVVNVSTPINPLLAHHPSPTQLIYSMAQSKQPIDLDTVLERMIQEGRAAPSNARIPVQSPAQPCIGENHDFEPVIVPRTTPHSPSRFIIPPEVEEEVLLDNIKEIRRDGPEPSGRAAPSNAPRIPVQSPAQPGIGENHDFEPVIVPRMTPHSPSRFIIPPEVEEEVLLDNIKELRRDGPVPSGVSLRDHISPPNGHLYTIRFDEIGKPVGPNAGKFSVKCGMYARMGHLFPLDVMWKSQAKSAKDMALEDLSKTFQSRVDFDFAHCALTTIRLRLKEWRYMVKKDHYLPFSTYEERIANRHPRVEEGQWRRLVELWNTEAKMAESKRNKANKGKQVIKHTLGRQSLSVLRDKMGDVLFSVAFVEGHKKAEGGYHNKETQALMEKVLSTQPTSSSNSIDSLFNDIYRLQHVIEDEKGKKYNGAYCTGVGGGVTKRRLSHPDGVFQTLTQSYVNQLRKEVTRAREDVESSKEDAKCARAEAEYERGKRVIIESNFKALQLKYESLEEVQHSTWQMFVDLQRQFSEFQRKILGFKY